MKTLAFERCFAEVCHSSLLESENLMFFVGNGGEKTQMGKKDCVAELLIDFAKFWA